MSRLNDGATDEEMRLRVQVADLKREISYHRLCAFQEAGDAIRAHWSKPRNARGCRATHDPHWAEVICRDLARKEGAS